MFVRAANPIWFMVDLVGAPLNDQYYAFFLTNTLPYLPQNVYMDNQGMSVWTNDIVQFLPNGTLPDNLYFDPTLVYRIEIRQGPTQNDPLIYEINNFVPEGGGGNTPGNPFPILFAENQVSNSTFSFVEFTAPMAGAPASFTITTAGTYQIGPGWQLVLTGSGSTTVTQLAFSGSGSSSSPNAINFALKIANAGWSTAVLQQQFNGNGAIFAGGAISMSLLAVGVSGAVSIAMNYVTSLGTVIPVLPLTIVPIGNFQSYSATINLPPSVNTDLAYTAFTQMQIVLPTTGTIDITDVQFVGQSEPIPGFAPEVVISTVTPEYQQETEERKIDHLFHNYVLSILVEPKTSLLTGWNFSLNPYQFVTTTLTTQSSQCVYIADQTILFSKTASTIKSGQFSSSNQRNGLQLQAVGAGSPVDNRFCLIQYIDPATAAPYWGYIMSSLIRMAIFSGFATNIRMKMRLIWRTNLPSTISPTEPIASWALNSDPVFSAGWTAISPLNDPVFIIQGERSNSTFFPFAFNGFQLPPYAGPGMTLGIVFYSIDPMNNNAGNPDNIVFDKISLSANPFAVDTQVETYDQSLRKCEFYYESSYDSGVLPGAITNNGQLRAESVFSGNMPIISYPTLFEFPYNSVKRATPTITIYSPSTGASNTVDSFIINNGGPSSSTESFSVNWPNNNIGLKSFCSGEGQNAALQSLNQNQTAKVSTYAIFQFTADSRLGR